MNTHLAEVLYLDVNNGVRQTELRNTIFEHTANLVQSLEYVNVVALLHHIASERKSCRTRTYYSNLYAV